MTVVVIVSAIFFMLVLIFGLKFAEIALKFTTSAAIGGVIWFVYGMATGNSSLLVWLGATIASLILIEFVMGD